MFCKCVSTNCIIIDIHVVYYTTHCIALDCTALHDETWHNKTGQEQATQYETTETSASSERRLRQSMDAGRGAIKRRSPCARCGVGRAARDAWRAMLAVHVAAAVILVIARSWFCNVGREAFRVQNQGLESSFCCWFVWQRLAQKEWFFTGTGSCECSRVRSQWVRKRGYVYTIVNLMPEKNSCTRQYWTAHCHMPHAYT